MPIVLKNKIILGAIGFIALLVALYFGFSSVIQTRLAEAQQSSVNPKVCFIGDSGDSPINAGTATNTRPAFLQTGKGTSTCVFTSSAYDTIGVMIQEFASTTGSATQGHPALEILRQASYDGQIWFNYDPGDVRTNALFAATSSAFTLSSTTAVINYKPSVQGVTTTQAFKFDPIPALQTRLIFQIQASATAMAAGFRDGLNLYVVVAGSIKN